MTEAKGADQPKTIGLLDQLRASRAIYDQALENIEALSDDELSRALADLASAATVARVLGIASADTVDRVLGIASDATVDRVLGFASDATVARVLGIASDATVARVLGFASDDTVARIKALREIEVPIVADLDRRVAEAAEAGNLKMDNWHCGTTHCRAGWAVVLGGEVGAKLESAVGSEFAGRLIYEASTGRPAPDFFASQDDALEDIRRCGAAA